MRILLDTHTFLWFIQGDSRLTKELRRIIELPNNTKFISVASVWEMAVKLSIGKLALEDPLQELLTRELKRFDLLTISLDHAIATATLPMHHRDPFDRMLIAQSRIESLPIMSIDVMFDAYNVERVWNLEEHA